MCRRHGWNRLGTGVMFRLIFAIPQTIYTCRNNMPSMSPKLKPERRARKGKGFVQKKLHSGVIQNHHISYVPEVVVPIWKGEHYILNMILKRQRVSKGFIQHLKIWIAEHENQAEELKLE